MVRWGEGREVDRYPGYHFEDLAWRYTGKIMQPLLVILDPCDEPAELVCHDGQEFNYVLEGSPGPIRSSSSTPATASTSTRSTRMASAAAEMSLQNS